METKQKLRNMLDKIDRKSYPAYKELKGVYKFEEYIFTIEHVQGDPFAAPSRVKIEVADKIAGFPRDLYEMKCKKIALQDYLLREFGRQIEHYSFKARGSGKSGLMAVSHPGQEVLERSACEMNEKDGSITLRMEIGLPANGRTINAGELIKILFEYIPEAVHRSLRYQSLNAAKIENAVGLAMNQDFIRRELRKRSMVAFIANGAILPRESGVSGKPMKNAIAWVSPKSLEVTMELPFGGAVTGTGIPEGVTLIVGGGYHGKSTLLEALELGVYNHIAGDGREYVITDDKAMKIRAEDGRSIQHVDISMFIRNLPNGKDTKVFCTEDASGSTSQAANVVEAMEAGSQVLLIDEDTSATNFMIRDELMQRVVHKEKEPIIPYIDRIRELYEKDGISTILVAGSSGAYFMKADLIIQMDHYTAYEITQYAKDEAVRYTRKAGVNGTTGEIEQAQLPDYDRKVKADKEWMQDRLKVKVLGLDSIMINHAGIDMRYVEQLVDTEQMQALAVIMQYAQKRKMNGERTIQKIVEEIYETLMKQGWKGIIENRDIPGNLVIPRKQEIFACINRYRKLHF
mgnify:FL=1